jgi:AmmeMemoRadiSam system protein A
MARTRLSEQKSSLTGTARAQLLALARRVIDVGCEGRRVPVRAAEFEPCARVVRSSFVTLFVDDVLRGCVGSLDATHPLAEDVAYNAYAAAFNDPRFTPVRSTELAQLHVHIAVLSSPQRLAVRSEEDLLAQLRPRVDGVVMEEGAIRVTFLPSVWEQWPQPHEFIARLKQKAGWPRDYWSAQLSVARYFVEEFSSV